MLAWLPGIAGFFIYYWILPSLRHAFPHLTEYERHLILSIDKNTIFLLTPLFALTILALFYQRRIQRTWLDAPFMVINVAFALVTGLCLLLFIFNIDPMPRQQ